MDSATFSEILTACLKALLALFGPIAMWVGTYNILEYRLFRRGWFREICYILAGLFVLTWTRALIGMSMVNAQIPVKTRSKRSNASIGMLYLKSLLSFLAYLCFWSGLESVLDENYIMEPSIWREVLWMVVGLVLLVLTDTFHVNAGVLTPMSYTTNLLTYTENVLNLAHHKHPSHPSQHQHSSAHGTGTADEV